jgi:hypothetical protein
MVHHPIDKNHPPSHSDPGWWMKYVPIVGVLVGFLRLVLDLFRR